MKEFLIDSDVVIDYLRGFQAARVFFESAEQNYLLFLSVVSLAEIYSGKDTKEPKRLTEIEQVVSNFEISLITPNIAKRAGFLRRDYGKPFADALIAATALEYDFVLSTRNTKDFLNIPELKLLKPYG